MMQPYHSCLQLTNMSMHSAATAAMQAVCCYCLSLAWQIYLYTVFS